MNWAEKLQILVMNMIKFWTLVSDSFANNSQFPTSCNLFAHIFNVINNCKPSLDICIVCNRGGIDFPMKITLRHNIKRCNGTLVTHNKLNYTVRKLRFKKVLEQTTLVCKSSICKNVLSSCYLNKIIFLLLQILNVFYYCTIDFLGPGQHC